MPRMNGIEFLRVVKQDETLKRIPVVVLTTSTEEQDKLDSFDLGVAGYMVKPVDYQQFVEVIKTIDLYWTLSELPPGRRVNHGKKNKILLVEDDKVDRMAFERFVKREGLPYDYQIAGSVAEARGSLAGAIRRRAIDYLLGDGTAFDLFDEIQDSPVVITGSGDEEIAVQAMKAGASDYLIKDPEGNYLKTLPMTVKVRSTASGRRGVEALPGTPGRVGGRAHGRTERGQRATRSRNRRAQAVEETLRESEERYRHILAMAAQCGHVRP